MLSNSLGRRDPQTEQSRVVKREVQITLWKLGEKINQAWAYSKKTSWGCEPCAETCMMVLERRIGGEMTGGTEPT